VNEDTAVGNADALERALARRREELAQLCDEEERDRHQSAIALMERYANLLREPTPAFARNSLLRYCFMLVFPDGRWSVDEKQLGERPRNGDVLSFDGYGEWRVQGTHRVMPRPAGKPAREFLVCAPVS
jgi:hypothetical protein